jgi:hypothetical protein
VHEKLHFLTNLLPFYNLLNFNDIKIVFFSLTQSQRNKKTPNIFCRFYDFRRVRFAKNGQVCVAGFCDPKKDVSKEDLDLWLNVDDSVFENLNEQQVGKKV